MSQERRAGMSDVSEKLGYISGQTDAIHSKLDKMDKKIEKNASKVAHVEKKVDRHRNIAVGAGTVLTAIVVQWEKIKHFFVGTHS